jgi:outer membrane receptor protein involved in Fe transport
MRLISKLSYMQSDLLYSYDEDWSYVGEFDASLWPYMGFDQYKRDIEQGDIDIRALSTESSRLFNGTTEWTLGVYAKQFEEKMNRYHPTDYGAELHFDSHYKTKNEAVYTQLDSHLNDKLTLISGLRVEKWEADYSDSHDVIIENDETMVGGKIGLNYQHNDTLHYYTTLSKGYRPGGVNAGTTLSEEEKTFGTETLWNLEAGVNSSHFDNTLTSRLNLFYGKRKDMQVKLYQEEERSFTDYLSNASKGTYYGVESQLDYMPIQTLHLYASLGLLKAEFDEYTPELEGRAPAQSPKYQYNIGFNYFLTENWKFSTNLEGKGSYYFSNTHNQKSEAYQLLNTSIEYMYGNWSAILWAKNITDADYQVRGFYFANNPANGYIDELYIQQGNPRTFGLTVSYDF